MTSLDNSPIGTTVAITGHDHRFGTDYEVRAFLPDRLPEDITLSGTTWTKIGDAMAEIGRLDSAASLLPNPQLVIRVVTRLEAVGTAALEGTYANLAELFAAEVESAQGEIPPRVREVLNFLDAVEIGHQWITSAPMSKTLLSKLQSTLVSGTDSDGPSAGRVRTDQVFIGPKHRPITEARFVPPPPGDQLDAMYDDWLDWVRDDQNPPPLQLLVRAAMAHYQFETIHPYHDGNGRVGRLAIVLQLIREKALSQPVLSVSPWLKEHEDEYKDHLLNLSLTGDWDPWVGFMAKAIAVEARRTQVRIENLLSLQEELSGRAREAFPRGRLAIDIADSLIGFPIITVAWAEKRFGKTNQASRNAIHQLVDREILEPYDEAQYDRRYWNPQVFQVIAR
ncbi:MAG: Fic family protein [bacterium]|nr:Fic family protein [bacterium]